MRKIIALVLVLTLLSVSGGTEAFNHQGGGEYGNDITYSGINLTGYQWITMMCDDWGGGVRGQIANATEYYELVEKGVNGGGYWQNNTLESVSDLDDYFAVLAEHPGSVVTANFVMDFMNGTAMLANGFTEFVGIPINKTGFIEETKYNSSSDNYRGDLAPKWIEGYTEGYWLPQYHGLTHTDMDWILQNASEGCATTIDIVVNHSIGVDSLPGTDFTTLGKDEYTNNPLLTIELGYTNKTTEQVQENLSIGLAEFYDLFGFHSESTVCPSYFYSNDTLAAFRNTTIYGAWGLPAYGFNDTGGYDTWDWYMLDYFDGISISSSEISIDRKNLTHLTTIMNDINATFGRGQVATIHDHRIGYTTGIRDTTFPGEVEAKLIFLDALLTGIETWYPNAWFLTGPELHQLNINGYSIQNWTDKVVVRNALPTTQSITVNLPEGWNSNTIRITDDDGVVRGYNTQSLSQIVVNTPHNDTLTIREFNYPPSYTGGEEIIESPVEEVPEESNDFCCGSVTAVVASCVSWLGLVGYTRRRRS